MKKLATEECKFIKKEDFGTGILLWVLQNSLEHLYYRTPPGTCFWIYKQYIAGLQKTIYSQI